jgi:hypothetical protein
VTKLERHASHRFPQFLPDGRQFLYYAQGTTETSGIYLGSLDSFEAKHLTAADTTGIYSSAGWLLFMRAGALLAQRLDLGRAELTGELVTVADDVAYEPGNSAGGFSVPATGLIAYRLGGVAERQLTWFDRSGKSLGNMGEPDTNGLMAPTLSPDGRRAAIHRAIQGNTDIWLQDGTKTTRFTFDSAADRYPAWSPDGSRVVFDSSRKGNRDLYIKPSNGAGSEQALVESPQNKSDSNWSRDGRFLLYYSNDPQTSFDLWVLPMEGERSSANSGVQQGKPFIFLKTKFDERRAQFSPNVRTDAGSPIAPMNRDVTRSMYGPLTRRRQRRQTQASGRFPLRAGSIRAGEPTARSYTTSRRMASSWPRRSRNREQPSHRARPCRCFRLEFTAAGLTSTRGFNMTFPPTGGS